MNDETQVQYTLQTFDPHETKDLNPEIFILQNLIFQLNIQLLLFFLL
jgi:hypothetical protein